jgi:hypothetical protein
MGIQLATVMHASTIARVDPSKDKSNPQLNKSWDALTPKAQELYKKVRDFYATNVKLSYVLMIQNVKNSALNAKAKEALIESLDKIYGSAMRISPYFPLMRFGKYWLQTGKKDSLRFEMFESAGDRDVAQSKYVKAMARQGKTEADLLSAKELSFGNDINTLRKKMADSSDLLRDVLLKISQLGEELSEEAKESLSQEVFQMHLLTLPETKFQKAFIHRKDTAGYSKDALHSFVTAGKRMSNQLANIKYSPRMLIAFISASDSIEG